MLIANINFEEFTDALKQMYPDKAFGPDGYSPAFFQQFWDLVGREVFQSSNKWLDDCMFPAELNSTNLVLIPEKDNVEKLTDVRPIALCNVVYKLIAKVLANRLKNVLPTAISENQSAFVPGRSITDNVLIAFESIHYTKRKKGNQEGDVALKLDISKAYDRVNWRYLWHRMRIMGFNEKWLAWMKLCVTTVNYVLKWIICRAYLPKTRIKAGRPALSLPFSLMCGRIISCPHRSSSG